ncbi:MAG: ABC transporter ATP-binding protein [Actinomycetota bacterium]
MTIRVEGLVKSYGRSAPPALREVDLEVAEGEMLVIVGPSGSGKSTLLRCIAGLESLDRGTIEVAGRDVTNAEPGDRDVAMVFQDYALYPHLDVATNIGFPLLARKVPQAQVDEAVAKTSDLLGIAPLLRRRPAELSGGERRRVSLARAVVREPAAFLMDEPLSNLDAALKLRVQSELRALQAELEATTLYVTHDQIEAMTIGHRIAVLRSGAIEQVGTPLDLYDRPANVFVASFLGRTPMNLFPADMLGPPNGAATVGIRPEHLRITIEGRLRGRVTALDELGSETLAELVVADRTVFVRTSRDNAPVVGQDVALDVEERHIYRFADDDTRIDG